MAVHCGALHVIQASITHFANGYHLNPINSIAATSRVSHHGWRITFPGLRLPIGRYPCTPHVGGASDVHQRTNHAKKGRISAKGRRPGCALRCPAIMIGMASANFNKSLRRFEMRFISNSAAGMTVPWSAAADRPARRPGLLASLIASLHHARQLQARRTLRQYRHLVDASGGLQRQSPHDETMT